MVTGRTSHGFRPKHTNGSTSGNRRRGINKLHQINRICIGAENAQSGGKAENSIDRRSLGLRRCCIWRSMRRNSNCLELDCWQHVRVRGGHQHGRSRHDRRCVVWLHWMGIKSMTNCQLKALIDVYDPESGAEPRIRFGSGSWMRPSGNVACIRTDGKPGLARVDYSSMPRKRLRW